ncbi:Frataxin, mitochondrial [Wickerhamomyces ciferrii]|uniref:ferroxidase n=1 Tax=Wickerhamomyces ciferrii (strain ATCC 14091 / BCRC 22168 / CBS 111 / JCM 3599 / NBRC 0793 / NRRL Y-1031 F-60-10) TaxID=1206466 RepID=K0KJC5_WICCF|nr:Frataxin, mitochondrial [Wickerhamomyces ciferrii]CCH41589.1 Frataxin, mitochondrial [Wickerhamomyces ciferrii]
MFRISRGLPLKAIQRASTRSFISTSYRSPLIKATFKPTSNLISKRFTSSDTDALNEGITDLDINTYHRISEDYLETLTDSLEALSEENPKIDAEYSHGVLSLVLPPNGTYVINKQPPNKQIWLSSPVSGPDRTKHKLGLLLKEEVALALDQPIEEIDLGGLDEE